MLVAVALALASTACSDDGAGTPDQSITVRAGEYDFVSDVVPDITAGDTVRFVVENVGVLVHELQVLDASTALLGRTELLAPGESAELVVTFDDEGIYQLICDVDDHLSRGQRALIQVAADG